MTFDTIDLSSISGIVLATMLGLEILKRIFQKEAWFGRIPVWVYSLVIAAGLAFIANKVLTKPNGEGPLLAGSTGIIVWRSILAAMTASGFYSWLRPGGSVSIASAQPLNLTQKPETELKPTESKDSTQENK